MDMQGRMGSKGRRDRMGITGWCGGEAMVMERGDSLCPTDQDDETQRAGGEGTGSPMRGCASIARSPSKEGPCTAGSSKAGRYRCPMCCRWCQQSISGIAAASNSATTSTFQVEFCSCCQRPGPPPFLAVTWGLLCRLGPPLLLFIGLVVVWLVRLHSDTVWMQQRAETPMDVTEVVH